LIHRVTFRAFVASTEEEERVREALSLFVPPASISSNVVTGHYGNRMEILEAVLNKKQGKAFFQRFREELSPLELELLRQEAPRRVDQECKLHFRLDKQAAYRGEVRLTASGDAIQVCTHLEAYPPERHDKAVKIVEDLL
jgi:RNA binding exosome subunit